MVAWQGKIEMVSRGVTCEDRREPLGVVASVVPFNFPVMVRPVTNQQLPMVLSRLVYSVACSPPI